MTAKSVVGPSAVCSRSRAEAALLDPRSNRGAGTRSNFFRANLNATRFSGPVYILDATLISVSWPSGRKKVQFANALPR
jgi:hypothetical protein